MKKNVFIIVFFIFLFLLSGCGQQNTTVNIPATEATSEPTTKPLLLSEDGLFAYNTTMKLYYEAVICDEEGVHIYEIELSLADEQWHTLTELLMPYETTMDSSDVLKSDFMKSYTIQKDGKVLAWIDAEGIYPEWGENLSYMFVWKYIGGSATRYGAFIDKSVVEYLDSINV